MKGSEFLAKLRSLGKATGVAVNYDKTAGKGSHG